MFVDPQRVGRGRPHSSLHSNLITSLPTSREYEISRDVLLSALGGGSGIVSLMQKRRLCRLWAALSAAVHKAGCIRERDGEREEEGRNSKRIFA